MMNWGEKCKFSLLKAVEGEGWMVDGKRTRELVFYPVSSLRRRRNASDGDPESLLFMSPLCATIPEGSNVYRNCQVLLPDAEGIEQFHRRIVRPLTGSVMQH